MACDCAYKPLIDCSSNASWASRLTWLDLMTWLDFDSWQLLTWLATWLLNRRLETRLGLERSATRDSTREYATCKQVWLSGFQFSFNAHLVIILVIGYNSAVRQSIEPFWQTFKVTNIIIHNTFDNQQLYWRSHQKWCETESGPNLIDRKLSWLEFDTSTTIFIKKIVMWYSTYAK